MARVKSMAADKASKLQSFPSFHKSGSVLGMKKKYYGKDALLVRCGDYIYNVSSKPRLYEEAS